MSEHFFTLAGVVADLGEATRTHSPETLQDVAASIDNLPLSLARGSAYLGWLLAHVSDDERNEAEEKNASYVLSELNAVVAALIELQNTAAILDLITQQASKNGGAA